MMRGTLRAMIDPERVYTADEAAELLRLTRRAVITAGKRYGLCFVRGRQVIFLGKHLIALIEAMRFKPLANTRYLQAYESGMAAGRLQKLLASQKRTRR